jgi:soluble lytic murein transglycosylase-like protein
MTDGINSVLQRINEIRTRFKLNQNNNIQPNEQKNNSADFDKVVDKISDKTSTNEVAGIPAINLINKTASKYAVKYGLPPSLVDAVIQVESNYNPNAVSKKGATGLMQLMPDVSKSLGIENPFDIRENIEGGVSILKNLINKYDWDLNKALAAYNAGENAVDKNNGIPPYQETRDYVKKVLDVYIDNIE